MATFTQWLKDQHKREDAVGWFSRYWDELPDHGRLSSPASIASHLEERPEGGFTDPAQPHLRDAYDQTLREYRRERASIAQAVVDGAPQPELPGMPQQAAGEPQETVEKRLVQETVSKRLADMEPPELKEGQPGFWQQRFDRQEARQKRMEAKLDLVVGALINAGLIRTEPIDWRALASAADFSAAVDG
jgi:hypothetical protein